MAQQPLPEFTAPVIEALRSNQYPYIIAGRGWIAKRPIPSGTLILQEPPFFRLCMNDFNVPETVGQNARWNQLQASPAPGITFHHGPAYDRFMTNRMRCGALIVPGPTPGSTVQRAAYGIFLRAAFFNASCRPNVHAHWDPEREVMEFRAIRDITDMEELCICYNVDNALLRTRAERQATLQNEFRFHCSCPACLVATHQSDSCRGNIRLIVHSGGSIQAAESALQYLQQEGLYHFADTLNFDLYIAWTQRSGEGQQARDNAMLYLQRARNIAAGMVGNNDERVRQLERRLARPYWGYIPQA